MDTHQCGLKENEEEYQRLPKFASIKQKVIRWYQLSILMSFNHPLARLYYRTYSAIRSARMQHAKSYKFIIHPFSSFRARWELFMVVVLIFLLVITPLNIAFAGHSKFHAIVFLNTVCFIDIALRFFTGYTVDHLKTVVLNPGQIKSHYLKSSNFYLEIIAAFPIVTLTYLSCVYTEQEHSVIASYLAAFNIIKVLRLKCLLEYLGHVLEYWHIIDHWYLGHVKFFVCFILAMHWGACIVVISELYFTLFSRFEPTCNNWQLAREANNPHSATDYYIYYEAIFLATQHLFCISRGGHKDTLNHGVLIQYVIGNLIGFVFWCFALVLFIQTLFKLNNADIRYESVMNQLNKYMRHKQLPMKMQQRLTDYYEFSLRKSYSREATIITLLSKRIQKEIDMHATKMMAKKVTLLKNLSDDVIGRIIAKMKPEVYLPNDPILIAGEEATCMYFIYTGTVGVYSPSGREICHLEDGNYFGEVGLITPEKKRIANVTALEITEAYRLDRKHFNQEIRNSLPDLYRKMESIAERRKENTLVMEEIHRKQMLEISMRYKLNKST